jgi:signal transduction histidine kinase/CheY-like chemotaxis protein
MTIPLRVLIAEDRPTDAELMMHELRRSGFDPNWIRVESEEEYLKELESGPDVILADHTLPAFDAPRALQLLKQSDLDIPLIVVTGSVSEDEAVERIKQGASDYILKDRMTRLGAAVKRALEEKKLRDEKRDAEEQIRRNFERIKALHDITVAITSTLDLHTMLDVLLDKIDLCLPFPSATTVKLLNRQTGMLESLASHNIDEEEWRAQQIRSLGGHAKIVVETKTPVIVPNMQTDARTDNHGIYRTHGLISYAGFPLIAKGQVLGVLGVYTKEEHQFTSEEIEFLTALADQAAVAIENSQLYEATKRQTAELQRKTEELESSNKVKDQFLSVMSHELRTPLTVVTGYAAMIQEGLFGEVNQKVKDALNTVTARSNDLLNLLTSILEATKIEAEDRTLNIDEIDLVDFIKGLETSYRKPLDKEIAIEWRCSRDLPAIKSDPEKLRRILQNLINNAVKFTGKGSVTISVDYSGEKQEVEFSIIDTGIGIPDECMESIFDKFSQVDSSSSRSYEGAGLGLYIVKKFTEILGGKVTVTSKLGQGSCFTITIPSAERSTRLPESKIPHKNSSLSHSDANMLNER